MARARKKKRPQAAASHNGINAKPGTNNRLNLPRSMVIRMGAGEVGASVSQLALDFRELVQPHTAARLKERKSNRLRDYTTMAGPLGVTHFFLFSRSNSGNVHLRFALHPRGPTLQFRVDDYVLSRDLQKAQRHSRMGWKEAFESPPLLVQHGMTSPSAQTDQDSKLKQLESLTQTMFNSMFPVITPSTTKLEKIKRILLLKREKVEDGTFVISLRHYAITTRRTGLSKTIRRFDPKEQRRREKKGSALPNLGKLEDMSDYLLNPNDGGYTSASETELDTDNEVDVVQTRTKRVLSRKAMEKVRNGEAQEEAVTTKTNTEKRAIKLVELGPRMKLRLIKVEEGLSEGRVMWNEYVSKTAAEEDELDAKWDEKRKVKEQRREEQKANVERKRQLREHTKKNSGKGEEDLEDSDASYDTDEVEDILEREANGQEEEDVGAVDEDEEMED